MAKKEARVKGLTGAEAMIKELGFLTSSNIGADFLANHERTNMPKKNGTTAKGKPPTHQEVIEFLEEGGRSLYPSESDQKEAAKTIRDEIAKKLSVTGKAVKTKEQVRAMKKRKALQGAVSGLLKATKKVARQISERMEKGQTTTGKAKVVESEYASQRARDWGVADSQALIYVASGQLARAIASGKVKVYFDEANTSRLLDNI
jgi:hypothetical protein